MNSKHSMKCGPSSLQSKSVKNQAETDIEDFERDLELDDQEESKSKSIASRLDRLETEINLLLMLSTKQPTSNQQNEKLENAGKSENLEKPVSPKENRKKLKSSPKNDKTDDQSTNERRQQNGNSSLMYGCCHHHNCACQFKQFKNFDKFPVEDSPISPATMMALKQKKIKERQENEVVEQKEKKTKRLKKKKSICRCHNKKKPNYTNLPETTDSSSPSGFVHPPQKKRSKSADPKYFIPSSSADLESDFSLPSEDPDYQQIHSNSKQHQKTSKTDSKQKPKPKTFSKSCPTSTHNIDAVDNLQTLYQFQNLCSLVKDINKNKNLAMSISDGWKSKYLEMKESCESLKCLQEQTNEQRKFLSLCFQTELQHKQMLEKLSKDAKCESCKSNEDQLSEVKENLEMQRSQNEELLNLCEDLRQELALSEERLKSLQESKEAGFKLNQEILEKFESKEEVLKSQASQKNEEFKRQINEHIDEIQELRLTCAKNAEWACEESSKNAKLLEENKILRQIVQQTQEKEQKQMTQVKVLRKALMSVGKNDPKVKKLLHALQQYEWVQPDINNEVTVGLHLTELSKFSNATCATSDEAKNLIHELTSIIKLQRNRIQELVDITSNLVTNDEELTNVGTNLNQNGNGNGSADHAPSAEQANELEMARKEVQEVKSRYEALASRVKEMRDFIKKTKSQLFDETQCKASLQNEVVVLSKLLDENNKHMSTKNETIERLELELKETKEEKNNLNKQLKELLKEKDFLKSSNESLHIDIIRQETIISNLEKKFDLHRHEQILQRIAVDKEKEQALRAAQFATDKLVESMEDFRRQSLSQTKVRHALTKLLQDKDELLRITIDKVSSMTLDPRKVVDALKAIKPTCQINLMSEPHPFGYETAIDVHYTENRVFDGLNLELTELDKISSVISEDLIEFHSINSNNDVSKRICDDEDEEKEENKKEINNFDLNRDKQFFDKSIKTCFKRNIDVNYYSTDNSGSDCNSPHLFTVHEEKEEEEEEDEEES